MTKVTRWVTIDGKRIDIPVNDDTAKEYGWHLGSEYKGTMFDYFQEMRFKDIGEWCRESFDPHTFALLHGNVWFYHERDAVLCKLKWG